MYGPIPATRWNDRDLYIIGGGPSLKGRNLQNLRSRGRVLGINKVPEIAPCDAMFTIDQKFLREYARQIREWAAAGVECTAGVGNTWFNDGHTPIPGVNYILRVQGTGIGGDEHQLRNLGFPPEVGTVVNGCNSGYSGTAYGLLRGALRIFLLGFDMNTPENEHFHDGYPWGAGNTGVYFPRWALKFCEIAAALPSGVEVLNCNPESAIKAFPFSTYDKIGI